MWHMGNRRGPALYELVRVRPRGGPFAEGQPSYDTKASEELEADANRSINIVIMNHVCETTEVQPATKPRSFDVGAALLHRSLGDQARRIAQIVRSIINECGNSTIAHKLMNEIGRASCRERV